MEQETHKHQPMPGQPSHAGSPAYIMAADTLTGKKVVSPEGEVLGHINHIMLDVVQGTIRYAVLSFGGVLGLGEKLFAVPWHAIALDAENKWLVLNVSKDRLRDAPGFDKDHLPSMADPQWFAEVDDYYGRVAPIPRPFI